MAKGEQKYYQNFDFYFKRTSFRTMTLFFKTAYKPFFEKWKATKKAKPVATSLLEFTKATFPGLVESLSEKAAFQFVELVKLLVFSHRHNKNDEYLAHPLVDFAVVREPMYKYSRHAQEKFFDFSPYAFLFAWFAHAPQAKKFSAVKFAENPDTRYPARMVKEIDLLGSEAAQHLRKLQMEAGAARAKEYDAFAGTAAI